jgi:hypothetical protein
VSPPTPPSPPSPPGGRVAPAADFWHESGASAPPVAAGDGIRTGWPVVAVAVLAGLAAALAGAAPTGDRVVDATLVAAVITGVTWLAAAALRWDAALAGLVAAATSWHPVGAAVAANTAVVGYVVPVRPAHRSLVTAVMAGVALNVAARSQLGGVLGLPTIVVVGLAVYLGAVGARRRTPEVRRTVVAVAAAAAVVGVLAAAAVGVTGLLATGDLRAADRHARAGLTALGDGDTEAARAAFADAAAEFARAHERTDTPLTAIARLVPGVAQHQRAAAELTGAGAAATDELDELLADVDLDALGTDDGGIDVDAVRALQQPLRAVDGQIEDLQVTIAGLDSPWLLPPVASRLDDLGDELDDQRRRSLDALAAVDLAPGLFGADGPRTYFVGFTTPAEARGIGGFMGNWAEITVTDGRIEVTAFGRSDELNAAGDPATRRFTTGPDGPGLEEWLARYGDYNLDSGPGGTTGPAVWKNMNMSPDMTATGRAIADLYPQSGGGPLDGVFMMDVHTLARLLEFTGPIPLPDGQVVDGATTVDADNAADFLLNDQYDVVRRAERVDILEEFSTEVIERLLGAPLPAPTDLLDTLGPMVEQGRFTGWAARDAEQELFARLGLSGTLPVVDTGLGSTNGAGGDALAITFNNAAGNKIDYYLDAEATYAVDADAGSSTARAELSLTLTNNAPTDGEPGYVIGNLVGLPESSNRTWVSVFSQLPVTDVRLDGQPVAIEIGAEADYFVTSAFITLGAGESATLTMTMDGRLDVTDGYDLALRSPPTVGSVPIRIDARWTDLDGDVHRTGELVRDPGLARLRLGTDR